MTTDRLAARIARERRDLNLKPWQLAPSEVDDGPSPWPPGSAGCDAWREAQRIRAAILEKNPRYFDAD